VARLEAPPLPLTDGVVRVRPPVRADVPAIVAACDDPEMARWLPRLPSPYGPGDAETWIDGAAQWWAEGSAATFVLEDADRDGVVGALSFEASPRGGMEMGWWLAPTARGAGRMTRAVRLVADWALGHAGVSSMHALIRPENAPSIAVAERAGFRRASLLPDELDDRGTRRDVWLYELPGPSGAEI
jgi:RimJ/RimL family protein N-acetyltransferase